MKRLAIFTMLFVFGATVSFAQNRQRGDFSPEDMAKRQTESMKEELGLDKDQEKKVYEVNLKSGKKMAEMRSKMQGSGGFSDEMRAKFGEIREEQNKELKKILTEAQWEKYEKYMEERRSRRGQGRGR